VSIEAAPSIEVVWFVAGSITGPPADIMAAMGSPAATIPIRHARLDILVASIAVASSIVAVSHTGVVAFTAEEASTGVAAE
jgi:hypothetical protein